MLPKIFRLLLVLWAGSLWSLALWVTWILFKAQPDRHLAGMLAGRLFSIECYLGIAVALIALLLPGRARFASGYAAAALLVISEWALRPVMEAAQSRGTALGLSFGAWHGVSMILYLIACIAVLVSVWNEDLW